MRLTLDLARNLVLALPSDSAVPDPLRITLGDPAFTLVLPANDTIAPLLDEAGALEESAEIEFIALAVPGGATIASGSATISSAAAADEVQEVNLGEDWTTALLVALFEADTEYVDILGSWRWKHGGDTEWTRTPWVTIRVWNSLFPSAIIPGAVTLGSDIYITSITDYTGSGDEYLDNLATTGLPVDTIVRIVTSNGESAWEVQTGTAVTNVGNGVIRPLDYHATTNIKNLVRISGV